MRRKPKPPAPAQPAPRLRLDVTLFAWMFGCAILLALDPERARKARSFDWPEIQLLLIVLAVYFVVNNWPRKS